MSTLTIKKKTKSKTTKRRQVEMYAGDAYSLAKRTAQGLNYLRRLVNIETKYSDTWGTGTADNTTGFIQCLNLISQGTDLTNRVGDSIRMQHMEFKFSPTVSITAFATSVRVLIIRDLENNGANPAMTDIFTGISTTQSPYLPLNFINTRTRFSILYDEILCVSYGGDATAACAYHSTHNGHIRFRGSSAAAGSLAQGSLFMVVLSNETTNVPSFKYQFRLEYTDD
jgi:hypothetical protein